ncbi:GFA family protein [Oceaniglobus trochenteri]|uniref:GFA family protein n=1 Tax=Oceaniglobus trochenteri TaxID=2763260 RepID=UPI001CFFBF6A|nr:GFA family protein [Oceaniglobus trochenteri]
MIHAQGGCLCGRVRYEATSQPARMTVCHCRFCQRATGGAYMVEPIFDMQEFRITEGTARIYSHVSEGSGKEVFVHFCENCGTKLFLTFERFPGSVGVYAGTFDDPDWFDVPPDATKHIFLGVAQKGTIVPPQVNTFTEHASTPDGTPIAPRVFDRPHVIGSR